MLNAAAGAVGTQAAIATLVEFPQVALSGADIPLVFLWVLLLWYGLRLLLRLAYSLIRFTVALVFGPVAIILWAIPQTEWVTWFWLREMIGWGTTPLLVTVALSIAVPLALGRSGELAAAAFGLAGFQAAYDLVGVLGLREQQVEDSAGHEPRRLCAGHPELHRREQQGHRFIGEKWRPDLRTCGARKRRTLNVQTGAHVNGVLADRVFV